MGMKFFYFYCIFNAMVHSFSNIFYRKYVESQKFILHSSSPTLPSTRTQEQLMLSDMCIAVDSFDNIIGSASKKDAHTISREYPKGRLHRAFSVFLFNKDNKLLLQQRAASKITFPNVWTNTCCSHPLYCEEEIDSNESIQSGAIGGIRAAARRKLLDELGIAPASLPPEDFKFLTRIRYFAPDSITYPENCTWCEHEVDYILFIRAEVDVLPNPDEVSDFKYVTESELRDMLRPSSGLLWSPWFRIIVDKFLTGWWKDLETTLLTDTFVDINTIHTF